MGLDVNGGFRTFFCSAKVACFILLFIRFFSLSRAFFLWFLTPFPLPTCIYERFMGLRGVTVGTWCGNCSCIAITGIDEGRECFSSDALPMAYSTVFSLRIAFLVLTNCRGLRCLTT